jgi:pimeloyl-ACP methyl ester carboxylesterase
VPLVRWPESPAPPGMPERSPSLLRAVALQPLLLRELFRRRSAIARVASGSPVLVIPGMGVGDWTTRPLRRALGEGGFDARGWGLGRHRPDVPRTLDRMLSRIEELARERGEKVALVGWSLGGLVARELARLRPDLVARVVTLGTPVVGGLRHTAIAGLFRLQGWDLDEVARLVEAANATPIRLPVTAIWSRRDGIVAWQACVDTMTPGAVNLEAASCHWGLGIDPDVQAAVVSALAP